MGVRAGERGLHQLGRRGPARGVSKNQGCQIHSFARVFKLQWQRRDGRLPGQGYGKVVDAGGDGQAEAHLRKVNRRWVGESINDTLIIELTMVIGYCDTGVVTELSATKSDVSKYPILSVPHFQITANST